MALGFLNFHLRASGRVTIFYCPAVTSNLSTAELGRSDPWASGASQLRPIDRERSIDSYKNLTLGGLYGMNNPHQLDKIYFLR